MVKIHSLNLHWGGAVVLTEWHNNHEPKGEGLNLHWGGAVVLTEVGHTRLCLNEASQSPLGWSGGADVKTNIQNTK